MGTILLNVGGYLYIYIYILNKSGCRSFGLGETSWFAVLFCFVFLNSHSRIFSDLLSSGVRSKVVKGQRTYRLFAGMLVLFRTSVLTTLPWKSTLLFCSFDCFAHLSGAMSSFNWNIFHDVTNLNYFNVFRLSLVFAQLSNCCITE